ncbi:MAG: hypothetical protein JJU37_01205 [Balneolaceae bacterium]|nr:hypothetical protein [Balneolaceae bacterium]
MNKYYFIFFIWLLPIYFFGQFGYQALTYFGIQSTYNQGDSYVATVTDFDVKQIAAQTNGYVVIQFNTSDGEVVEERLALPVQFAQVIMNSELIPVRYSESSFSPIVMMPIYDLQQNVIRVNLAVTLFGTIVTILISFFASRYALRKVKDGDDEIEIEMMDEITPAVS